MASRSPPHSRDAFASTDEFLTSADTLDASLDPSLDTYVDFPRGPVKKRVNKRGDSIGRYVLLDPIGTGGMGTVWTAYDTKLDRKVALKLLRAIYAASDQAKRRLEREARALAQLSHPNVVQVHDFEFSGGQLFVAMEYVEGMSLKEWCDSDPKPTWEQILAAYIDAARGLAAAHEKDMIHRDFKPANVLRGNDGRVRVVDFGLAIAQRNKAEETKPDNTKELHARREPVRPALEEEDPRAALSTDKLRISGDFKERLTNSGLVIGTPLYMAPEQYVSGEVGPAADQYSLCVSLYEGLYGTPPFSDVDADGGISKLFESKQKGELLPVPDDTPVPAWLNKVVMRGLSADPDDRYSSIDDLAAALSNNPARRRRARLRAAVLIGITITSVLLAVLALTYGRDLGAKMCRDLDAELEGVWDDDVKERVRDQFLATGLGYAPSTFDRAAGFLDDYAASWVSMRTEACEATRIHQTQTDRVMTLRMTCLNRRRSRLGALTKLLSASADPELVTNAVQAVQALPPIDGCADVEALSAAFPLPDDPVARRQIEEFEERVDEIEAMTDSGKYQEALQRGEGLLDEMRSLDYAPLRARAMYWMGFVQDEVGDNAAAESLLRQTIQTAAAANDPILVAKASSLLQYIVGYSQRRYQVALDMKDWVLAAAELADDDVTRAESRNHLALILRRMERFEGAKDLLEEAITLLENAEGTDHPSLAVYASNLALALRRMDQYEEAKKLAQQALSIRQHLLGPEHPDVASSLTQLAGVFLRTAQYSEARELLEQALAIRRKQPENRTTPAGHRAQQSRVRISKSGPI